jgi:ribosomal protein L20A (L18A)
VFKDFGNTMVTTQQSQQQSMATTKQVNNTNKVKKLTVNYSDINTHQGIEFKIIEFDNKAWRQQTKSTP